jgi:hypothetical protein
VVETVRTLRSLYKLKKSSLYQGATVCDKTDTCTYHKSHGDGWGVSLTCSASEEYDRRGKKQETPVQVSSVHPTELGCLHELLKRPQDRHVDYTESVVKKAQLIQWIQIHQMYCR